MTSQSDIFAIGENLNGKPLVIFLHIPKAGGTTLNGIINQKYSKNRTFRFNGINQKHELAKIAEYKRRNLQLIRGHFAFGLHKYLSCPSTYFTLLREPVKREISHYHYVRRSSNLKGFNEVQSQTLEEFILASKGNIQTRLLYGLSDIKAQNDNEMLKIAKQHLEQYFSVIGLVERFDESLILLQDAFDWSTPVYVKQNITSQRQLNSQSISASTMELIQERNSMDIKLYEYAKEKFEQQIDSLGERFDKLFQIQQHRNHLYQPLGRAYNFSRYVFLKHILQRY
ncbi:sulfotransferase family 2 domain-containing protein [Leptothoe sp. LEGE 181152]|nr:sulfotransferase family 2 domain-containing protein [Leptothoe sp. LEGE 181152]